MAVKTFVKGSSVFTCRSCDRSTRYTGDQGSEYDRLCPQCWELAGLYNAWQDGHLDAAYAREALACVAALDKKGQQHGDKARAEYADLLAAAEALLGAGAPAAEAPEAPDAQPAAGTEASGFRYASKAELAAMDAAARAAYRTARRRAARAARKARAGDSK